MSKRRRRIIVRRYSLRLALVTMLVLALPATSATLTWYTDRAAWEAALGSTFSLIDFQATAAGNYGTQDGVTIDDVQFTAKNESNNWFLYLSDNDPLNQNLYASGGLTNAYVSAQFTNAGTFKAVGMDVTSTTPALFWAKVNVGDAWYPTDGWAVQWNDPGYFGFIGLISDEGVNQVWVRSNSAYNVDNFVFANGSELPPDPGETPDLDTLILCGTGLSILSFLMRLRQRAARV
jgi:hypothetical protein